MPLPTRMTPRLSAFILSRLSSDLLQSLKKTASFIFSPPRILVQDKKTGDRLFNYPLVCRSLIASDLGDRNGLLRTVLHAGLAVYAFGHVHRIGLAAVQLEHGLRTDVHARTVAVALVLINGNHVHGGSFLPTPSGVCSLIICSSLLPGRPRICMNSSLQ